MPERAIASISLAWSACSSAATFRITLLLLLPNLIAWFGNLWGPSFQVPKLVLLKSDASLHLALSRWNRGDYWGYVLRAHRLLERGRIDTSTYSPIRQVLVPICFISAPAVEYSRVNGLVDGGCHRVTGVQRLGSDGPIVVVFLCQYFIDAV